MTSFSQQSSTSIIILKLLEVAKQDKADIEIVYTHVKSVLAVQESEQRHQQEAWYSLFSTLIAHYNQHIEASSPLHQHLELLKLRLGSQPGLSELNEIRAILAKASVNNEDFRSDRSIKTSVNDIDSTEYSNSTTQHIDPVPSPILPTVELSPTHNEFRILDKKRQRMVEIQAALSLHLSEVAEQNRALGKALDTELNNINNSSNIGELQTLKQELSNEISNLLQGHQSLTETLDNANKFMQIIESEGQDLNDELKKAHTLSLTDELTQLPNRRAFFKRIEDEVSRVQRYEYPLCLALVDLDAFKSINDRYGHNTGDEVLRSFAERALSGFRHHDLASRYGGEEFAIILPNTDLSGAQRALEKVRGRTSQCTFQYNGDTYPIPTFSAGIAHYVAGETAESFIERADQLLYRAKRMGRNRIEIAETVKGNEAIKASPQSPSPLSSE